MNKEDISKLVFQDIVNIVRNVYENVFVARKNASNFLSKRIQYYIEKYIKNKTISNSADDNVDDNISDEIDIEEISRNFELAEYIIIQELNKIIKESFEISKYLKPDIKIYLAEENDICNIDIILYDDPDFKDTIIFGEFNNFFIRKKKNIKIKFLINLYFRRFYLMYSFFCLKDEDFKYFASMLSSIIGHELRHLYQNLKISLNKEYYNKISNLVSKLVRKTYISYNKDIDKYFTQYSELDAYAFSIFFTLYLVYNGDIKIIKEKIKRVLNGTNQDDTNDIGLLVMYVKKWGKDSDIVKKLVKKIYMFLDKVEK